MAKKKKMLRGPTEANSQEIVPVLQGYLQEAQNARNGGLNPRDDKWEENLNLYWNRYDMSGKASWQAQETMPEVPAFVDRFAAALKDALVTGPTGFYTVEDPADKSFELGRAIKRITDVWLSVCGRNQTGHPLGFPAVFEEQIKLGSLMACSSVVDWRNDYGAGRVAIETVDPRQVWLDPTYRNLYRIRRTELDKHALKKMAMDTDRNKVPIFNLQAIEQMITHIEYEDQRRREELTGHGHQYSSTRQPITMDEYIATVVANDGRVLAEDALMVVGNGQFLIRGPEPNPYWHKKDWLVYSPLVLTPLSVYGRSYMEDFGSVAKTFTNLTNLILDAVQTSSLKAFAVVPSMLLNPEQLAEGITPNKAFYLEEGFRAEEFMKAIDLGNLPAESVTVWQQMKNELREAADMNEVGLGQFAPKGRTSATEISQTQESSSALIRSIAQTLETRYLSPTLDLAWKTGLQHMRKDDPMLSSAAGPDWWPIIWENRRELAARPITFQARGISQLIQKNKMLRALLQLMQILAQSDYLLQAFLQEVDIQKFMKLLFELSDIDMTKLALTEQDKLIRQFTGQMGQVGQNVAGAPPATGNQQQAMRQLAQGMGINRGRPQ